MRVEFIQTFEDFNEAQRTHALVAARATQSTQVAVMLWQIASSAITGALCYVWDPRSVAPGHSAWLMTILVIPATPWLIILLYLLWFQARNSREAPMFEPPWKRQKLADSKPVKTPRISKVFRSAIINIAVGVWIMYMSASNTGSSAIDSVIWGVGWSYIPWGIYLLWGAAVARVTRGQQITSWHKQTQLHDRNVFDFDSSHVVQETPVSRTEFKWEAFGGIVESPTLFLLYRSPALFFIIPKRAFATSELIDAFRAMANNLAGKGPAGFPVLQAAPVAEGKASLAAAP